MKCHLGGFPLVCMPVSTEIDDRFLGLCQDPVLGSLHVSVCLRPKAKISVATLALENFDWCIPIDELRRGYFFARAIDVNHEGAGRLAAVLGQCASLGVRGCFVD